VFEPLHYDKLLLTTGSLVRELDVPGSENRGIHYLRSIGQSDALRDGLREVCKFW
jgi:3-phenylpropionate/trans-cinnamate dioxygenase ferredoxin reductase subunit